jgi:ribonuclease
MWGRRRAAQRKNTPFDTLAAKGKESRMNSMSQKLHSYVSILLSGIALTAAVSGCAVPEEGTNASQDTVQEPDAGKSQDGGQQTSALQAIALVTQRHGDRPSTTASAIDFWDGQHWPNYGYSGRWLPHEYTYTTTSCLGPSLSSGACNIQWHRAYEYIYGGQTYGDRDGQLTRDMNREFPPPPGIDNHYTFTEYDITFFRHWPYWRNAERIVRCNQTGDIYYTNDHYQNFVHIQTGRWDPFN